jgi:hypothetical protein
MEEPKSLATNDSLLEFVSQSMDEVHSGTWTTVPAVWLLRCAQIVHLDIEKKIRVPVARGTKTDGMSK